MAKRMVVFSSGVGYGDAPALGDHWTVYCVRGPMSAKALGLEPQLAITDGAMLIRRVIEPCNDKRHPISYMPHLLQDKGNPDAFRSACEAEGFHYISPSDRPESVIDQINHSELLITSALHGAITADALRVPWIPVKTHKGILTFKWHDWCRSLGMEYVPHALTSPWTPTPETSSFARMRYMLKWRLLRSQLRKLIRSVQPMLSPETRMLDAVGRLCERLDVFKADVAAGRFAPRD